MPWMTPFEMRMSARTTSGDAGHRARAAGLAR
jgi:hypothetical protein